MQWCFVASGFINETFLCVLLNVLPGFLGLESNGWDGFMTFKHAIDHMLHLAAASFSSVFLPWAQHLVTDSLSGGTALRLNFILGPSRCEDRFGLEVWLPPTPAPPPSPEELRIPMEKACTALHRTEPRGTRSLSTDWESVLEDERREKLSALNLSLHWCRALTRWNFHTTVRNSIKLS